jgi:hypothetical protein
MVRNQRLIVSALLGFGIGLLVLAGLSGRDDDSDISVTANPAIDALIPARESEILRRDRVGIDLAAGYAAALTLEAGGEMIPVPTDQIDDAQQSLGLFTYKPEDGKVLPFFPAQSNCVTATYWPVEDREDVQTIRWCFEVT